MALHGNNNDRQYASDHEPEPPRDYEMDGLKPHKLYISSQHKFPLVAHSDIGPCFRAWSWQISKSSLSVLEQSTLATTVPHGIILTGLKSSPLSTFLM